MYSLSSIAEITFSHFSGGVNHTVSIFLNDSRNLQSPADTLFIALKTPRNNGHHFINELVQKGVKSFLIQEGEFDFSACKDTDVSFIVSPDPLIVLQNLASYHRQRFSIPVIGITGSNGKTVVKEWLYQLLKNKYTICRSPKSYNSQVGVPLSVLNLNSSHNLAIFEAGISLPGEMDRLASIIRPTIGILTSFGSAHDEGFSSRGQKLNEKMKLLAGSDLLIINGVDKQDIGELPAGQTIFVSGKGDADIQANYHDGLLHLSGHFGKHTFRLPYSDTASIQNAATCSALLLQLNWPAAEIESGLKTLLPVALRLEIKNGIHNSLVINDYYNSDLDSFKIALNYLRQQNRREKKVVIVSDIEQSGIKPSSLYKQLAGLVVEHGIDLMIGIGMEIMAHRALFKADFLFFTDTTSFIGQFKQVEYKLSDASILLKGARSFGFENISRLLQQKSHDTVFEINLNKLTDNINYYRSLLQGKVKLMCMVKAMGYGSGGAEIARTLQHIGVDYLAVAYSDEGVELRQSQVSVPVMVMNPEEDAFEDIINYRLEPEIYCFRLLHGFAQKLDSMGITEAYPVHIKIDTGMHRLGFEEKDMDKLTAALKTYRQMKVRSVFSHLAGSDNSSLDEFTRQQVTRFGQAGAFMEKELGYPVIKHICNSGAIRRHPEAHFDMVRLGIGMYGIGVNDEEQARLQNVGSLKTRISQIRVVMAGDTVSYNRSGKINATTSIATLPIGYADGFSRVLGNGRHGVYINNRYCPTVGNVCMDMCMVDVTGIDCVEGDEAIIFGNVEQINTLAKALNSIPYEALTNLSARVKRIYIYE